MKTCTECGEAKEETEFHKRKASKDGLQARCKACIAAAGAAWAKRNPEKVRAKNEAWGKANPDKESARKAAWAKKNPEKVTAVVTAWRKANPDKVSAASAAWNKANPDKRRTYCHNRRALKKAGGTLSPDIVEIKMKAQGGLCTCCGMPLTEWHIDHIVPLSGGGPNTDDNVQLLLPRCNQSKGTKTMDEYMQHRYKQAA